METVAKACCIIHNMIAKERGNKATMKFRQYLEEEEKMVIDMKKSDRVECQYLQGQMWREGFVDIENREDYNLFTQALIDNIWNRAGED